jgi:NitT/TauT family transport system permease protein
MTALSSSTEKNVGRAVTREEAPSTGRVALLAGATAGTWFLLAFVTLAWPDIGEWGRSLELASGAIGLAVFLLAGTLASRGTGRLGPRIRYLLPWALVLGISATLWQVLTAKTGVLPMPFFPPPHALLEVFIDERDKLVESIIGSMKLLGLGVVIGIAAGLATGIAIGWSRRFGYWIHPIMRLVGPLPAIAWLPLAFFAFPSSFSASIFLIALAVGFPVTVLTWSGVASTNPAYYDVARTLGADERFLVLKVAIPAALPHVFVGLFMGLGASFSVLVTAEMMGVKAGLGFYLQWAQGWAAYSNMYAALLVMAGLFSGLITLLFKLRDKVLAYQNRDVQW